MRFHIPFTIADTEKLKRKSRYFLRPFKNKKPSQIQKYLENSDIELTEAEYFSICLRSFVFSFIFLYIMSTIALVLLKVPLPFLLSFGIALIFSGFRFFSQIVYPKVHDKRRVKNIEKNLIPALEDVLVQLNSGIPLFNILVNISSSDYGSLSEEFKKLVRKINAGAPQIDALEEVGEKNSSIYFKRTIWQISNSMRAGSDISIIISENIKTLNEEQLLQIQNYGNKLNPLIMFYMVISVILPALGIAFFTVISSLINLPQSLVVVLLVGLLIFVTLIQIIFIGIVRSVRPSLL